jgi:hypothetical protein
MPRVEPGPPDVDGRRSARVRPVDLSDRIRFLERRLRAASLQQFNTEELQALEELLETIRGLVSPTNPD